MPTNRRFALCALLISLVAPLASAQVYKITDLGPLSPTAINIWGQVVGKPMDRLSSGRNLQA